VILAATAVKHSFDDWAGGCSLCMTFAVDTYKSMKNTVLDTYLTFSRYIYSAIQKLGKYPTRDGRINPGDTYGQD